MIQALALEQMSHLKLFIFQIQALLNITVIHIFIKQLLRKPEELQDLLITLVVAVHLSQAQEELAEELTLMEILQLVGMVEAEAEDADLSEEPTTKEEMEKADVLNYITK